MGLAAGTRLGPYEILAPIGAGGMGEVYRAKDTKLKRDVALKVLPEAFAADPERMARFQREAEVLASLNHPNIAQIYGVEDRALVMEFVEGESPKGPLPLDDAWKIASQIAAGLEYAHEKGIVHRDLKPANIKITPDGVVKLLDFGLAKAFTGQTASAGNADNSPTLTLGATQLGVILGTAAYMAPEQAKGKAVDKRADIWSFGVVLYELITGERLFSGDDVSDTLADVLKKQPNLERVPVQARRLLRECLQRDPKERLRDIGDAKRQLVEEAPPPPPPTTLSATSRPRFGIISTALVTVLTLALGVLAFLHFREHPPVVKTIRFQILAPEKTTLSPSSSPSIPALSPDGSRVVFLAADQGGRMQLWIRSLDTLDARPLAGTEGAGVPEFWSPDSRTVAFPQGNRLRKVDVSGGPPQTVCDLPEGPRYTGGAWSPDGVIVFGNQRLWRVSEAGSAPVPLTKIDTSRSEIAHAYPSFLPGGRRFIYFRLAPTLEANGVYLGSLDLKPEQQSSQRLLAGTGNAIYAPLPDPDHLNAGSRSNAGHLLFLREGALMAQPFDARREVLAGEAFTVAEGIASFNGDGWFSTSSTGVLVYRTGGGALDTTQLTWFDRTGKNLGTAGEPGHYDVVSLSPDASRAAVEHLDASTGAGKSDIWVHDLARRTPTRITFGPTRNGWPAWLPDGSRVAFTSNREGAMNLYLHDASGAGNEELLLKSGENKFVQDVSRDGRFLMYSQNGAGVMDLWVLPLGPQGGANGSAPGMPMPYLKTEFYESEGRFSPDGHFVAYNSNSSGRSEIYVQPFPDPSKGKWQISRTGGTHPRWRHDGRELFYISADLKMMAVEVSLTPTFTPSVPKVLFPASISGGGAVSNVTRYDVTGDGRKFLIASVQGSESGPPSAPITVVLNWQAGLKK
jgi:serine/threonine protein kinase